MRYADNHILNNKLKVLRVLLVIPALLLTFNGVYPQTPEPIFRRYTVDDGLASSEVYHVIQDSEGYMWFATNNGVSRYNGYKFENFDLESGLVDNTVFEVFEDYLKRIWFIPLTGKLSYFQNNQVIDFEYNDKIKDHLPYSRGPVKCSFYVDSTDNIHLGLRQFGRIRITPNGDYTKYSEIYAEGEIVAEEIAPGKVIISNPYNAPTYDIVFLGKNQKFRFTPQQLSSSWNYIYPQYTFFITTPDSSVIFSLNEFIFKVRHGKLIERKDFKQFIIWMSTDKDNNLWVAKLNGGIQCYQNCAINEKPRMEFLKDVQVTSVIQDREGSYWFTSLNDGVFYCPDVQFQTYTKSNGLADDRVNSILVNKTGILVGFEMGFIDLIKDEKIIHLPSSNPLAKSTNVFSITGDSLRDDAWVCSSLFLVKVNGDKVKIFDKDPYSYQIYPRMAVPSKRGNYWLGTTKGLKLFDGKNLLYESNLTQEFSGVIYSLIEDTKGRVWFTSSNGLWAYADKQFTHLGSEKPLLAQMSNSILINPIDSCLWIGTNGSGIVVYGADTLYQITEKDGLVSNSIHKIFYSANNVWAATRQGLSKIAINNKKYQITNFTIADGLPTNEVTSVYVHGDNVYAGTSKGLSIFNLKNITKNLMSPKATILEFYVNGSLIDHTKKPIKLKYDQNNFNINFLGLVYRNEGNVTYRYRVKGIDSTWIITQSTNCSYSGLTRGKYTFEVEVLNSYGIWSPQPAQVQFTISPPYWQKTWFVILCTVLFTLILFLIYRVRVSSLKKRNELINNINLYKQQSLRQQMNPHFIFNTLNSIQLFILEKDSISSHKYLTKFARLMRMTLDNSLYPTIPLRDEIEALKIYLELEALRLVGKFEYTIDVGVNSTILENKIPTLLIQPFVENAIWHGIMLKENQTGWVKITLKDADSFIRCTIEDNGVGREMANTIQQKKNKEHKSRGSQITQQRIDLLNTLYKDKFNIRFTDLFNNEGLPEGTMVEISIPKELSHQ